MSNEIIVILSPIDNDQLHILNVADPRPDWGKKHWECYRNVPTLPMDAPIIDDMGADTWVWRGDAANLELAKLKLAAAAFESINQSVFTDMDWFDTNEVIDLRKRIISHLWPN